MSGGDKRRGDCCCLPFMLSACWRSPNYRPGLFAAPVFVNANGVASDALTAALPKQAMKAKARQNQQQPYHNKPHDNRHRACIGQRPRRQKIGGWVLYSRRCGGSCRHDISPLSHRATLMSSWARLQSTAEVRGCCCTYMGLIRYLATHPALSSSQCFDPSTWT